MSDNHHDDYQPAYRGMLEEISNDEELDRRVMARVHDLRSGQQETEDARRVTGRQASATRRDPRPRSSVCTRRAIVTAGAAIAGCALLGVAVPAGRRFFGDDQTQPATRRDTPESTIPTTSGSAQNDAGAHSFGLAVAMANEPDSSGRTSFELASTAEGLLPMVTGDARVSQYRMNFTTVGEGIERLIYRLEDIPARFNVQSLLYGGQSSTDALHFMKCLRSTLIGLAREGWSTYIFNMTEEGEQPNVTQFEVSRNDHEAGNDGILNNGTYWTIVAYTPAKFWEDDELLSLFNKAYINKIFTINPTHAGNDIDPATVWQAYHTRFDGDGDALLKWMRSCYVSCLKHTANLLAQATLAVDALFEDGVCATRRYHLEAIPKFEKAASERFDALLACSPYEIMGNGEIVDKLGTSYGQDNQYPPLFDLVAGEPPQDIDDPRLSAPLFTITDVTDDEM